MSPDTSQTPRVLCSTLGLALAGSVLVSAPAAHAATTVSKCRRPSDHVVARTPELEVRTARAPRGSIPGNRIFACDPKVGRRLGLGGRRDHITIHSLRASGRFVAFGAENLYEGDAGMGAVKLTVARLDRRRLRRRVVDSELSLGYEAYHALVVTSTGALAYTGYTNSQTGVFRCRPWGCGSQGTQDTGLPELLERDSNAPLATGLHRTPAGVAWTTNGVRHETGV